ncbi:MAG: hypothetical protein LBQ96_02580 [Fusobacteriaceae bacterium]|jgi:hypothetical protein|nr:hypothetical protein [Fusobacteriaceae bacterium]
MQIKKFIVFMAAVTMMAGCDMTPAGTASAPKAPAGISLTEDELKAANGNSNVVAQMLVRKSVLSEIKSNPFSAEELKVLENAKENLEIEFYLDKEAQKIVTVTDAEVLKVYEDNKDKLENADPVTVMPQLKQALIQQKIGAEKVNLINGFIAKYGLNDILKKYIPQATEVPAETGSAPAPAATETTVAPAAAPAPAPAAATPPAATESNKPAEEKKN